MKYRQTLRNSWTCEIIFFFCCGNTAQVALRSSGFSMLLDHTHTHTHTHTKHTHTHKHTHKTHTQTHTNTYTQIHTHKHTQIHTHKHTHKHTNAHKHTHSRAPLNEWSASHKGHHLFSTTITREEHPCRQWDSNPQTRQSSRRMFMP